MSPQWTDLVDDYVLFHKESLACLDYDPVIPVLAHLARDWNLDRTVWAVLAYVAYDDLGSALPVIDEHHGPAVPERRLLALPVSARRRSHSNPDKLARHFQAVVDAARAWCAPRGGTGMGGWLLAGIEGVPPHHVHDTLRRWVGQLYGNGPWAAWRTCELLAYVLPLAARLRGEPTADAFFDLAPRSIGPDRDPAPRAALGMLAHGLSEAVRRQNTPQAVATCDTVATALQKRLRGDEAAGAPLNLMGRTLAQFRAMYSGMGYVGHGIDTQLMQLHRVPSPGPSWAGAFAARRALLPPAYLGEIGGWFGPQLTRCEVYRRERRVVIRTMDGDATAVAGTLARDAEPEEVAGS